MRVDLFLLADQFYNYAHFFLCVIYLLIIKNWFYIKNIIINHCHHKKIKTKEY